MTQAGQKILGKMLDRLFGAIVNGPSLNCRPHSSRQRVDFTMLSRLKDMDPASALRELLGEKAESKLTAHVPVPPMPKRTDRFGSRTKAAAPPPDAPVEDAPDVRSARQDWESLQSLLLKLRILADDAKTYEDDTGVYVLNIGFPLLSLPPGVGAGATRRVLAPIAFIPVALTVKAGPTPVVELACKADEVDRVQPNEALLAWLEQQTGVPRPELFSDEEGSNPWREIGEVVRYVATAAKIEPPVLFTHPMMPAHIPLVASPKSDENAAAPSIICSAVLGLFPMANQSLLRDTRAMLDGEPVKGPIESFLRADARFDQPPPEPGQQAPQPVARQVRVFEKERLIAQADPCQSRAVTLARTCAGLVVHGPPGTGKSQTITNIIGDHLARGERVLFVCEKRTALDVVANRLEHLGLGNLCALIHDPQRDQRDLYMAIREQLEGLADTRSNPAAEKELVRSDDELQRLHLELSDYWRHLLDSPEPGAASLHDLVGRWLGVSVQGRPYDGASLGVPDIDDGTLKNTTLDELTSHTLEVRETLKRAEEVGYAANPWTKCAGLSLESLLSRPMDSWRAAIRACVRAGQEADALRDPLMAPFSPDLPLNDQAAARGAFADSLQGLLKGIDPAVTGLWASRDRDAVLKAKRALDDAAPFIEILRAGPPDAELALTTKAATPDVGEIARHLATLEAYLPIARAWYGFLFFGRRSAAGTVLSRYGLAATADNAERVRRFLASLRAVLVLRTLLDELRGTTPEPGLPDRDALDRALRSHQQVVDVLARAHGDATLHGLGPLVAAALGAAASGDAETGEALVESLQRSVQRARALIRLEEAARGGSLFTADWLNNTCASWRRGENAGVAMAVLEERLPTLEGVLRTREGLTRVPPAIGAALAKLVDASIDSQSGEAALRKAVLGVEISRRLESNPRLRSLDARRIQTLFERYRELDELKKRLVRDTVVHKWVSKQKERLLVTTGSRLNSAGADLRRRLTTRGAKAMRLRQVVAYGAGVEGGDPLMDLRPVWMASPETVAQIFPRQPHFDVVVFDEASQCRLEEALPVLTRSRRVVIAGDPKQLPPTRFFESGVAASETDEIETDQQLFELQQGEIEDLLGAALCLDIQQCYLDVHYRSRNSDLISFSNRNFYDARLQPIPGHPSNRTHYAPITLYRSDGAYEKRTNPAEADQVCRIVRDLLKRADPPSIGIGCFNLTQRDLIVDKLDELAEQDAEFAANLARARQRRGRGAFEGLFVKNLENVQGDERDHIIISTTYGPDANGKFFRRFGPLAMPGGGRRLNVLVTRARDEVHLVTSIPRSSYHSLPPVPQGQTPGGGWLLFAYLKYAEELAATYERMRRIELPTETAGASTPDDPMRGGNLEKRGDASTTVLASDSPSVLAEAFARRLASAAGISSDVHWGNDGFCVDIALRHPVRPEEVTVGVLCDFTRFDLAQDPVEWDIFRTSILESQGWSLQRLWSPILFRDSRGCARTVLERAAELVRTEDAKDTIRVQKP